MTGDRRQSVLIGRLLVLGFICCLGLLYLGFRLETVERTYNTWKEAKESGVVGGVLPSFLPESATDIWYRFNHDNRAFRGGFRFEAKDRAKLNSSLVGTHELRFIEGRPPGVPRLWPEALRKDFDAKRLRELGFEAYRYKDWSVEGYLVVDGRKMSAFFWSADG